MKDLLKYVFLLCCILLSLFIHAQDIPLIRYSKEDGLPGNTIYAAYRDSKGFLWFGTDRGVSRYNGIHFDNFNTGNGLADNEVFSFAEDGQGRLWMGTFNGALCFYKDGRFHTEANTPFLHLPFRKAVIWRMQPEKDGSISMAFHNQSIFINIHNDHISIHNLDRLGIDGDRESLFGIIKLPGKVYNIITKYRSLRVDTAGNLLSSTPHTPPGIVDGDEEQLRARNGIYTVQGRPLLSFTGNSPLARYIGRKAGAVRLYKLLYLAGTSFLFTSDGLWINDSLHLLPGLATAPLAADNAGNYWIPTSGGLYRISANLFAARQYSDVYKGKIAYAHADSTGVFLANEKGELFRFANGMVSSISTYQPKPWHLTLPNAVACIIADSTYYCFYKNSHTVLSNIYSRHPTRHQYHDSLHYQWKNLFVKDHRLYALLYDALMRVDYSRQKPGATLHMRELPGSIPKERIFSSAADAANNIWYATTTGVYRLVHDSAIVQRQFGTASFKWMTICGNYLVGLSHSNQLLVCNNFAGPGIAIDTIKDQGVTWNKAWPLDGTHLLLSTDNLYRVLTLAQAVQRPLYSLLTIENPYIPTDAEYICAAAGQCWFFRGGSIFRIGIGRLVQKPQLPRLLFTTLRTGADTIQLSPAPPYRLTLPYAAAQNLLLSFAVLSFNNRHISYEYSVAPDSTFPSWIPIKNEEINLISPGCGYHCIQLRARTLSGDYTAPISFHLTIAPPFWARLSFLLPAFLIALVALVWAARTIFRYYIAQREKKHAAEIRFMRSEYKALNALMNPHFIFNSLNSIQGLVNNDNKAAANEYLQHFSDLVRQNMQNLSHELIPLEKEMQIVTNYLRLEQLRFQGWLTYRIDIDPELEMELILVPPLLIQPLVENTLKHGLLPRQSADNLLLIRVYERADTVYIEIEDNGVGLHHPHTAPMHQSHGLSNIRQRIHQLNRIHQRPIKFRIEELQDDDGTPRGTLAVLSVAG